MNYETDRATLIWYATKVTGLSYDQVREDLRGVDVSKTYRDLRLAKGSSRLAILAPYLAHNSRVVRDVAQCRYEELSKKRFVGAGGEIGRRIGLKIRRFLIRP